MWEIELKIPISQPETVAQKLNQLGSWQGHFEKKDIYYTPLTNPQGPTAFRLRQENSTWIVTHKAKTINQGIENSRETEFNVSDPQAFDTFVRALGYTTAIKKIKLGQWWKLDHDFKAELSEVPPLGHWLELEILLPDEASENLVHSSRTRLEFVLSQLELDPETIEARPYTEMLRQAQTR